MDALHEIKGPMYVVLIAHATLGGVALVMGAIALSLRKGSLFHRRAGLAFIVAMAASVACAIPVIVTRRNLFLALLTPFVVYLMARGFLSAHRSGARAQRILASIALVGSVGLIVLGVVRAFQGQSLLGMPGAFLGLGVLGGWLSARHVRSPAALTPPASVIAHATAMIGAYTAAVTAFTAVNFPTDVYAGTAVWLMPVAAGTSLAVWWGRRIRLGKATFDVGPLGGKPANRQP
jgi:uncharacterized membrane protein